MKTNVVGFYWTRPVNWAGFVKLPKNADAAAKVSQTIRYQRERVRRWAKGNAREVVGEVVFIDRSPYEPNPAIITELRAAQRLCLRHAAELVYVDFAKRHYWRKNTWLDHFMQQAEVTCTGLDPDPIDIDGEEFNPVKHFRTWVERDERGKDRTRSGALRALAATRDEVPEGRGQWGKIAAILNARGIKTVTGRTWTDDSVRKSMPLLQNHDDESRSRLLAKGQSHS